MIFAQYDRQDLTKRPFADKIADAAQRANDLVGAALTLHPQIGEVMNAVENIAGNVRMSGSGGTCYALFTQRKSAWTAAAQLAELPMRVWVSRIMQGRSNKLGSGQVVRQRILAPSCVGSNPTSPATFTHLYEGSAKAKPGH